MIFPQLDSNWHHFKLAPRRFQFLFNLPHGLALPCVQIWYASRACICKRILFKFDKYRLIELEICNLFLRFVICCIFQLRPIKMDEFKLYFQMQGWFSSTQLENVYFFKAWISCNWVRALLDQVHYLKWVEDDAKRKSLLWDSSS